MNTEQAILEAVRVLPPEKQEELLAHARRLRVQSEAPRRPRKNGRGLWADLGIDLTAADIDEARREMWKNFPRDDS
ncbi:MAG: hypothetical protein ABSB15_25705 [Bryobacteraceae bacterium]